MRLVLACTAMALLASAVELARPEWRRRNTIGQAYRAANITPVPDSILEVSFDELVITLGIKIPPEVTVVLPTIGFDFDPGCYYTFLAINLDWPTPDNPFLSPALVGLYVNLLAPTLQDSCEVSPWFGINPLPCSGLNRFLLYVYRQSGLIDSTDEAIRRYRINRQVFPFDDFVKKYNLKGPTAGNFFLSRYPRNCKVGFSSLKTNCSIQEFYLESLSHTYVAGHFHFK